METVGRPWKLRHHGRARARYLTAPALAVVLSVGGALPAAASPVIRTATAGSKASDVAQAEAFLRQHEGLDTAWDGPTSGPTAAKGKSIFVIGSDFTNTAIVEYADDVKKAGAALGWKVTLLDGQGTESGWVAAFGAAIARKASGIVTDVNIASVLPQADAAAKAGIKIVGIHAAGLPQAYPQYHLFYNIESSPTQIGQAEAEYAIATSDGHARVAIIYDDEYQIARVKADAMKDEILKCGGCKLLAFVNTPSADESTDMPPLATRFWSKYGKGMYLLSITDSYFDYAVPTLRSIGVPSSGPDSMILVGADGTASGYQRIRSNEYEVADVPEPFGLFGYEAIDELNRAFHGDAPYPYTPSVHIVTKSDINEEGGKKDEYTPDTNFAAHYLKIWKG